jgi:hypothetical protein
MSVKGYAHDVRETPTLKDEGRYVGSLNSSEKRFLLAAISNVRYVPLGKVLFLREGTLMAQSL